MKTRASNPPARENNNVVGPLIAPRIRLRVTTIRSATDPFRRRTAKMCHDVGQPQLDAGHRTSSSSGIQRSASDRTQRD
jgi:hypothetical protein